MFLRKKSLLIYLCLILFSNPLFAWNKLTSKFDLSCQQIEKNLHCGYRTLTESNVTSITAKSNSSNLPTTDNYAYSDGSNTTAILFLVDTSDPARQNVIEKNKAHLKEIISTLKSHEKAGLASFDKSLKIQSDIGTSTFLLSKSLDNLKASGKTTELYRNLLKAMEPLISFEANRKVIVLLSDGQAEDKAYFHTDVIKMARKHGVVINSIGYPRSIPLSVALQTLRRLSEETGGTYVETTPTFNLTDNNLRSIFDNMNNGGTFSVPLDELYQSDKSVNFITLSFSASTVIKHVQVPVTIEIEKKAIIKSAVSPIIEKEYIASTPITKPAENNIPIQIITKHSPQPINLWIWYGLPAAFIIIIIFILITLYLLWRKPEQQSNNSKNEYKPYAYLVAKDDSAKRYPITRTICRIGRSKDNELSLDDASISRRHAEIHRNNDGSFDIIDMNSMNGVYINNEKIGKAELHEGDVLEIGDFFLHFTQLASDYSLEESTVMQKTRTPTH